jgi:hypothetical protein
MNKRPPSITFIAWFLIVGGVIGALASPLSLNNPVVLEAMAKIPLSIPVQVAWTYIGLSITIVSGLFMLRGANWARFLYIGWIAVSNLLALVISPAKTTLIPGLIVYGIIFFFLLQPKANQFFNGSGHLEK